MSRKGYAYNAYRQGMNRLPAGLNLHFSRSLVIGIILILALIAFEIFNFDTTRYALDNLMGDAAFLGLTWATILAIAFCAIDFAGLAHLFTPQKGADEPREVWYLMGAWLLGATMNAIMTWWAVSLVLLNHDFGNEVLNREQLLKYVPIFVAILVWLTRILFIGAFSAAGDNLFRPENSSPAKAPAAVPSSPNSGRGRQPMPLPAMTSPPPTNQPLRTSPKNGRPAGTPNSRPGANRLQPSQPGMQASPKQTN